MTGSILCTVLIHRNYSVGAPPKDPDFKYKCTPTQYCCYNYTVPHSPWCCDPHLVVYKDWYLWVILSVITVLIAATFFYFRFFQKRQLERRIHNATMALEAHYRPLASTLQQVVLPEENKPSDPPPSYTSGAPPSYTLDKEVMTDPLPLPPLERREQRSVERREQRSEISFFSSSGGPS